MPRHNARTPEQVRRDVQAEREHLARAVDVLRQDLGKATDVAGKLRANLPVIAAGALGVGFAFAGGIGATMRLLARRGREGREKARVGRFSLVDRD